jgi:6-pyruvoyl-tetrahydropterin synthase related domain
LSLPIADCRLPIADCRISMMRAQIENRQLAIGSWQFRPVSLVVIASLAVMVPAILWGIPSNLDLTNHFRFALPFYDAIASGDPYPGWLAESNGGYGDPSFRFYPPALYYLLAGARFLIGNWYGATLLAFTAVSIFGGLGMYFWTRSFLPSSAAAWAGIFYALAPYHVNQLYQATLLAEWAGSAVLPFVFGFVERVCERGKSRDIAGLAASYSLLVFTHLPLAVIGSIALLVYVLMKLNGPEKLRKLAKLSVAVGLGLSVSAIYWVTMISEIKWIGINDVDPDPSVDYRYNFLFSTLSPDNLSVWWMNILAVMTVLLCAPALLFFFRSATSLRRVIRPVIVITAVALFMSLPLSRPIWGVLRPLQETQFPWRWLAIFSMGASIIAAAALPLLADAAIRLDRAKRMLIFGAIAIAVAFTLSHTVREAQYLPQPRFETALSAVRGTSSVNYWFPIWANSNPKEMTTEVEAAAREVSVTSWQPEHRKFSVAAGPATQARVRTFYYPHWTATNEGGFLQTRPDKDGALLISLPENATSVDLDFREPRRTKFSTIGSLSGLMLIGALALPFRRRKKQ